MGKVLSKTQYAQLLEDVRGILTEGRLRAQQAVANELVLTYWTLGQRIVASQLAENAGYGQAVMKDLAEDLDMDLDTLQRSVLFFKTYNTAPRSGNLSWSHYKELLRIKDDKARQWYEQEASQQGLARDRLLKLIREDAYQQEQGTSPSKKKRGLKRPTDVMYVYKAEVVRVVDGDTLLVRLDLGFATWREQRIRLAEIDTPPLDTPEGKQAADFVQQQLAVVDFVVVKTNQVDIYGRYVGHVFYKSGERDKVKVFKSGKYLSEQLLERGLAKRV